MVTTLEEKTDRRLHDLPDRRLHDSPPVLSWGGLVQWGLLTVAFLYFYASVGTDLVADWWNDPDYSHGFLVPILTAYFVWEKRQNLVRAIPHPHWGGLCILLLGLMVFFLGHLGAELFLMRSSMIIVIVGLVVYILGWLYLRLLAFPIAFLLFMIPLPAIFLNLITFPLQLLAARMSTFSLQLVNMPVYREGNIIFLPHITLEIIEACSGLRSLMSLMALSVVFACITQRQTWKRLVLVASSIPIALVANAFRIWGTGILAHFFGPEVADGFYHAFAGWSVFVVAFGLLLIQGVVLSRLGFRHARLGE